MKIPIAIYGKNKIRDSYVCSLWSRDHKTMDEVASKVGISISRVQQIVWKNRDLIKPDKSYEKIKRIHWLNRQVNKATECKKDPADLLEQLRKEIEGNTPLIDQSQHQHFTKVDINTEEFRSKSTNEKIDLILGRIK